MNKFGVLSQQLYRIQLPALTHQNLLPLTVSYSSQLTISPRVTLVFQRIPRFRRSTKVVEDRLHTRSQRGSRVSSVQVLPRSGEACGVAHRGQTLELHGLGRFQIVLRLGVVGLSHLLNCFLLVVTSHLLGVLSWNFHKSYVRYYTTDWHTYFGFFFIFNIVSSTINFCFSLSTLCLCLILWFLVADTSLYYSSHFVDNLLTLTTNSLLIWFHIFNAHCHHNACSIHL